MRIAILGPSGVGKTTLCKALALDSKNQLAYVSASSRDLLPQASIKQIDHLDDSEFDLQLISKRTQLFNNLMEHSGSFITDRSLLDSAAYYILKYSSTKQSCDIDEIVSHCLKETMKTFDYVINIPYSVGGNPSWKFEDNGSRIVNTYYQETVSLVQSNLAYRLSIEDSSYFNRIRNCDINLTTESRIEFIKTIIYPHEVTRAGLL